MAELKIEQYVVGLIQTNCYFAINEDTKELFIVDPGAEADRIITMIKEKGLKPVAVILTHGHFDHASGAEKIAKEFDIQIIAHEAEKETLENPSINMCGMLRGNESYYADYYVKDGEVLHLAGFDVKVLHTPGHTKGGCCYYIETEKTVFSGDTLFCESVGRSDFPGGSASVLVRSIEEKLMPMPEDTKVYPGHNEITTIGWEKMNNPFL